MDFIYKFGLDSNKTLLPLPHKDLLVDITSFTNREFFKQPQEYSDDRQDENDQESTDRE